MKAKLKEINKYEISRKGVTKKRLSKVPVPINRGTRRVDGMPSPNAEKNYMRRMKDRARTIREKCQNSFTKDTAIHVVLTFDEQKCAEINTTDITQTHNLFNKFVKRVNRRYEGFCYVATFNRQKNQKIHYHLMTNLPIHGTIEKTEQVLSELWQCGFVYVKKISSQKHFKRCVNYLIENMNKFSSNTHGVRGYLASHNAKSNIIVSSGRASDKEKYKEIDSKVSKYPLSLLYSRSILIGLVNDVSPNCPIKDVILDYDRYLTPSAEGYKPLEMTLTAYSSPVRYNNLFPQPKAAKLKPAAPKKSAEKKAKKPAKKHSRDKNSTSQIRV